MIWLFTAEVKLSMAEIGFWLDIFALIKSQNKEPAGLEVNK